MSLLTTFNVSDEGNKSVVYAYPINFLKLDKAPSMSLFNEDGDGRKLLIDCVVNEHKSYTKTISDVPLELGSNINDNSVLQPTVITVDAVVSRDPFSYKGWADTYGAVAGAVGDALGAISNRGKAEGDEQDEVVEATDDNKYVEEVRDFFEFCLQPNVLVTLDVSLGLHVNYSVTSVGKVVNGDEAGTVQVQFTCQEIRFVQSLKIGSEDFDLYEPPEVPDLAESQEGLASLVKALRQVKEDEVDLSDEDQRRSWLKSLVKFARSVATWAGGDIPDIPDL